MIFITEELLENNEHISCMIQNEKHLITYSKEFQESLKSILLDFMQKLAVSTDNVDMQFADTILNILNNFKRCLELFNTNMNLLDKLFEQISNLSFDIDNKENISDFTDKFNTSFSESYKTISENTAEIKNILNTALPYYNFTLSEVNSSIENNFSIKECIEKKLPQLETSDKEIVKCNNTDSFVENTLIISERTNKVILPHTLDEINDILKNNSQNYSTIEDVIEDKYTLNFDLFRNPAISRFREAFKLIRKKENGSIKEAFDLGMELLFNYNLHPAIITACNNLDELDIYLDYLESNETHKFDLFKITFDIAPVIVNNKRS